jgi:hypothetical protein
MHALKGVIFSTQLHMYIMNNERLCYTDICSVICGYCVQTRTERIILKII